MSAELLAIYGGVFILLVGLLFFCATGEDDTEGYNQRSRRDSRYKHDNSRVLQDSEMASRVTARQEQQHHQHQQRHQHHQHIQRQLHQQREQRPQSTELRRDLMYADPKPKKLVSPTKLKPDVKKIEVASIYSLAPPVPPHPLSRPGGGLATKKILVKKAINKGPGSSGLLAEQQSGVKEEDGTSSDYEYEKFRQSKSVGYHGKPPKKKHHSKNNKVSPLRHQGSMGYRGSSKRQTTLTLSR